MPAAVCGNCRPFAATAACATACCASAMRSATEAVFSAWFVFRFGFLLNSSDRFEVVVFGGDLLVSPRSFRSSGTPQKYNSSLADRPCLGDGDNAGTSWDCEVLPPPAPEVVNKPGTPPAFLDGRLPFRTAEPAEGAPPRSFLLFICRSTSLALFGPTAVELEFSAELAVSAKATSSVFCIFRKFLYNARSFLSPWVAALLVVVALLGAAVISFAASPKGCALFAILSRIDCFKLLGSPAPLEVVPPPPCFAAFAPC
mmetsp:Transcript_2011/g.4683  ORF Transcript_2011/g.4683 Transcript_2011/m.4683 type:complete len:257 (+) Transcript_2011:1074-1844(+)